MRILITADTELPVPPKFYGGIERIVDLLVAELRNLGHEVALVANSESTSSANQFFPWRGMRSPLGNIISKIEQRQPSSLASVKLNLLYNQPMY